MGKIRTFIEKCTGFIIPRASHLAKANFSLLFPCVLASSVEDIKISHGSPR